MADRTFNVFVSYHVLPGNGQGMIKFGNLFVTVDVNRSSEGYLPECLTPRMIAQIRGQVAISEDVDEERIYVANLQMAETPPGSKEDDADPEE